MGFGGSATLKVLMSLQFVRGILVQWSKVN
jgi:hypothetical protein